MNFVFYLIKKKMKKKTKIPVHSDDVLVVFCFCILLHQSDLMRNLPGIFRRRRFLFVVVVV